MILSRFKGYGTMPPDSFRTVMLRGLGRYGQTTSSTQIQSQDLHGNMNVETSIASIFKSLTAGAVDFFGGSTSEAKIAAAQAAQAQAQYAIEAAHAKAVMWKWVIGGGVVIGSGLIFAAILKARG